MYSYSKIVFGLKHHHRLYDCETFIDLRHSLRTIIYEHNGDIDACERPGLHYHGIIEHGVYSNMDINDAIMQLKTYCAYFKIEICNSPEQFVVDMAQQYTTVMVVEIAKSLNLTTYYNKTADFADMRLELGYFEKEYSKMLDIKLIIKKISDRRIFDPVEIYKQIVEDNYYYSTPKELERLVTDSIALVHQKILDQSIVELCDGFLKCSESYYTLQESTDLVVEWCLYQNLNVQSFTMNWVKCLDKQVLHRNAMYIQGSTESGVMSIIRSIADACMFIGVIDNESTGYSYVWEECLKKRCIIMQDPVFDERMFEELENILKGIGTFVPHRQNTLEYLYPTPVIVISSKNDWERDLYLERLQDRFLQSYVNLKPFVKLHSDSRLLHPDWLNVLYKFFNGQNIDSSESRSDDPLERMMDSESSYELKVEGDLISIASVSSTTYLVGTPNPACESRDEAELTIPIASVSSKTHFVGPPNSTFEFNDKVELTNPVASMSSKTLCVGMPNLGCTQDSWPTVECCKMAYIRQLVPVEKC